MPVPVRVGLPGDGYPWGCGSFVAWFDGDVAADVALDDPIGEARRLGAFVQALHMPAPADAPLNAFRGQPIAELRPRVANSIERLGATIDAAAVAARLDGLADVEDWHEAPVWLHGDLHSANVVVRYGAIIAVIDFGDVTSGDPAVDLAVGWMLFDDAALECFARRQGRPTTPPGSVRRHGRCTSRRCTCCILPTVRASGGWGGS